MKNLLLPGYGGRQVRWLHYAELSSTQLGCKDLLTEYNAPLILTAGRQAAGRGRLERRWESPLGNFYGSLLWDYSGQPHLALVELALLTVDYLHKLGIEARLKWPNDIMVADKKIAGLLGETIPQADGQLVLLGLGLNVNVMPEGDLRYPAATIKDLLHEIPIIEFRNDFVPYLAANMVPQSNLSQLISRYNAQCSTLGRPVELEISKNKIVQGQAVAVDENLGLIIEDKWGKRKTYNCGDIRHLTCR